MGREQFNNTVKVEWLENHPRNMRLLEDVVFIDSKGKPWIALAYSIINGASIPEIFWPVVGSPYVGLYRRASVIHDVYCENHLRSAQATHDVFYEMLIADGVDEDKAKLMYTAVNMGGPRW